MKRIAATALLLVAGVAHAAKPKFVQISKDIYLVTVQNHAGVFGSESTTKRKAIEAANKFAQDKGMEIEPFALEYRGAGGPGHWPAAEYQFKLVPLGQGNSMGLRKKTELDVTVNTNAPTPAPTSQPAASSSSDMYSELLRLDDLHKRGILTDAEFKSQKAKLLTRP